MTHLPPGRIKTIMKSTADVETVGRESVQTLTRAAELFIKSLAKEGYKDAKQNKTLDYKNLANVVHKNDKYEFLREIVPQKITVRKYRDLMAKKQAGNKGSGKSSSDSDSSSESSDDENKSSGVSKSSDMASKKKEDN